MKTAVIEIENVFLQNGFRLKFLTFEEMMQKFL